MQAQSHIIQLWKKANYGNSSKSNGIKLHTSTYHKGINSVTVKICGQNVWSSSSPIKYLTQHFKNSKIECFFLWCNEQKSSIKYSGLLLCILWLQEIVYQVFSILNRFQILMQKYLKISKEMLFSQTATSYTDHTCIK